MMPMIEIRKRGFAGFVNSAIAPGMRVLDVGCGNGFITSLVDGDVYGIDPKPGDAPNLFMGQAESIPFPDGFFDVAYSIATFHHIEDKGKALDEICRVLKPSGRLIIIDSIKRSLAVKAVTLAMKPLTVMLRKNMEREEPESGYHSHNDYGRLVSMVSARFSISKVAIRNGLSYYMEAYIRSKRIARAMSAMGGMGFLPPYGFNLEAVKCV